MAHFMSPLAPQEIRTFFITSVVWNRRSLFQTDRMSQLIIDVLRTNRAQARFQLHEFVIMPDHIHVILTPAYEHPLEKCVQFIKGGFSFRTKKELGFKDEIWQRQYTEHRIKDARDYREHAIYVRENPVRANLVPNAMGWKYSSASITDILDPAPEHLQGQSPAF
jgi:putative transposase